MLTPTELVNLFQDSIENKYVFNAVKEWVDWVLVDTMKGIAYGVVGLVFIASLGALVS